MGVGWAILVAGAETNLSSSRDYKWGVGAIQEFPYGTIMKTFYYGITNGGRQYRNLPSSLVEQLYKNIYYVSTHGGGNTGFSKNNNYTNHSGMTNQNRHCCSNWTNLQ